MYANNVTSTIKAKFLFQSHRWSSMWKTQVELPTISIQQGSCAFAVFSRSSSNCQFDLAAPIITILEYANNQGLLRTSRSAAPAEEQLGSQWSCCKACCGLPFQSAELALCLVSSSLVGKLPLVRKEKYRKCSRTQQQLHMLAQLEFVLNVYTGDWCYLGTYAAVPYWR